MTFKRFLPGPAMLFCLLASCHGAPAPSNMPGVYSGMCDASAAVPLGAGMFLVADDEQNVLHVYRTDKGGPPVAAIPWNAHLAINPLEERHPEADVEGATTLGNRIYWITSHGRNRQGEWRRNRHRFFAMTVRHTADGVIAEPFGTAYADLAKDLARDPKLQGLGLAEAVGTEQKKSKELAPKRAGLNIEALAATPDGRSLLIAFRNPRPDDKALVVPLLNPAAVLADGAAPQFGQPIRWKLQAFREGERVALGIRSIEYSQRHGAYLIIAGPHDAHKVFAVYKWSGSEDEPPALLQRSTAAINRIERFTPEALIVYPDKDRVGVLSDDGTLPVKVASPAECSPGEFEDGECQAKHLLDSRRKTFRGVWIEVD